MPPEPPPPPPPSSAVGQKRQRSTRWRTGAEQQIYSSRLAGALRRPFSAASVRRAADRLLAVSAKGRTRWSRAILTGRFSLTRTGSTGKRHRRAGPPKPDVGIKKPAPSRKRLPPLQRKVRALSRLIPGCRKLSLPNLLEETADYIAALEMQVKGMAQLAGLLNGGVSGGRAAR
ncbi:transcription factor bHLH150-like [Andrographis paniculata]|uniref:transcription factor bHLH150-like n=1 Tax=Andrographis paniculata TaxID=175694 RepID=UPI0021E83B21|nr:transcription factor bHLH150-like [Andrographis paniculata]